MIVSPEVERYLAGLAAPRDEALREMEALAEERGFPIVGAEVGRLLGMLAATAGARRVLELGSGFGYSAVWFARALPPDGRVICTDFSDENRARAEGFFRKAGVAAKVEFRVGDALGIARTLDAPFDIVFNDVDKEAYPDVVPLAVTLLRSGGLFISDNALWGGKVAGDGKVDPATAALKRFNTAVSRHPGLETVIIPLRDGLAVCRKE